MTTTTATAKKPRRGARSWISVGLKVAILILGAVMAVLVVQAGAARSAIMLGAPRKAPSWTQGFVLSLKAEQLFDDGQIAQAGVLAHRAIRVNASDVAALRTLALVAEDKGEMDRALGLMAVSARWSWRDATTQWWLFNQLLRNGDIEAAMVHGEALVAQGQSPEQVWPIFAALAGDPQGRTALLTALQRGQRWRGGFYRYLRNAPPEQQPPLAQLMRDLAKTSARPGPGDVAPLLEAMLASGNAAQARDLWRSLFWKGPLPMPLIHDGGFERTAADAAAAEDAGLFRWRFDPDAEIYLAKSPVQNGGRAAHIVRAGGRQRVSIQQRLALDPGDWLLSFSLRGDDVDAASQLRIGIRCTGKGGAWLTEPFTNPADGNWHRHDLPFQVGENCAGQTLIVEPVGAQAGDRVDVWLDDFGIRPAA